MKYKVILLFLIVVATCESKRILAVYPITSISHQIVFRPLMLELAKRGHDVTVITPDAMFPKGKTPPNFTEIDVHNVSYYIWKDFLAHHAGDMENHMDFLPKAYKIFIAVCEAQFQFPEVQDLIKNSSNKFDLIFTESMLRPPLVFSHIYKTPVISFSSFSGQHDNFETIGAASHPILYAIQTHQKIFNLTLWEKVTELFKRYYVDYKYYQLEEIETAMIRRVFGSDVPHINDLKSNIKMLFLNVHHLWDFNRPVPPNVVYLGGFHVKPANPLPQDLQTYLDSSKNGVIYVSFGSNIKPSLLPKDKLKVLTKVFSELPYDILWRWDVLDYPECPKNVRISTWFPQTDILAHPKIKMFITQAGLQSTDESITAGVPLLGIPQLWDQWYNADHYLIHNLGQRISLSDLTEGTLRTAIQDILDNNQRYRDNVARYRGLLRDQPQSPLERAVWWTEHVLRTGGSHLRSPAANITWAEYYQIDVILLLLGVLLFISILIVFAVRYVVSKFNSVRKSIVKYKEN